MTESKLLTLSNEEYIVKEVLKEGFKDTRTRHETNDVRVEGFQDWFIGSIYLRKA